MQKQGPPNNKRSYIHISHTIPKDHLLKIKIFIMNDINFNIKT